MTIEGMTGGEIPFPEFRCWWHEVIGHGLGGSDNDWAATYENTIAADLGLPLRSVERHRPWDGRQPLNVSTVETEQFQPLTNSNDEIYTGPVPMRPSLPSQEPN